MMRKRKFRWGALGALITTVVGVAADPHVAAAVHAVWPALPAPVAASLTVIGAVWAAATKPVVRKEHERTP